MRAIRNVQNSYFKHSYSVTLQQTNVFMYLTNVVRLKGTNI